MPTGQLLREMKMPDDIEPCPTCLGHGEVCSTCDLPEVECHCFIGDLVAYDPVLCWECNGVGVVAEQK
jgi:hypothetical protein